MEMSEWRKITIGEIAKFNVNSIKKGYKYNSIEYLDIAAVGSNCFTDTQTYNLAEAPNRAKRLVSDGDIIFSTVRPNLRTYLRIRKPKDNLVVSTGFAVISPKKGIDSDFLFYAITKSNVIDELSAIAESKTTSYPAVTPDDISGIKIDVPSYSTQTKIGKFLYSYDSLIENNNRRIAILEEMAQKLYREWFVHFRFPGHENVKMVESEMGLIPEGWEVDVFSQAVDVNPKYPKPSAPYFSFVDMAGLETNRMIVSIKEQRPSFTGAKFSNGDTLVARITPCLENGKTGFVQCLADGEIGTGSTEFIVLKSKKLSAEFVYLLSRQDDFRGTLIKSMSGASGRQRANANVLDDFLVCIPSHTVLTTFSAFAEPAFKEIEQLNRKNINLRQTRDLLLPRLISGDIDVSELDIPIKEG